MIQALTLKRIVVALIGLLLTALVVTVVASVVQAANNANQFSNELTNPDDVAAGGTKGAVDLHLKNVSDIAVVNTNRMAAYYPKSVGKNSSSSMQLKITNGRKGRVCHIAPAATGAIEITIRVKDNTRSKTIPIDKVCSTSQFFGTTVNFPNGEFYADDSGFYKAVITVKFTGPAKHSNVLGGSDQYSLNYNMKLAGTASGKGKLALLENSNPQQFGFRSSYRDTNGAAGNQRVQAAVVFGYPCDVKPADLTADKRTVRIYDADTVFGDTYMWVEKDDKPLKKGDYANTVRTAGWNGDRWKLAGSNGTFNALTMTKDVISINAEYKLVLLNTGAGGTVSPHNNTLSLSIPYDSIYGSNKCGYELEPSVNPPGPTFSNVGQGEAIEVQGHVVPEGFDGDEHDWELTARVFNSKPTNTSGATNNKTACNWKAGKAGSCKALASGSGKKFRAEQFDTATKLYSTSGLESGDWVCFAMSVRKPKYEAPENQWRHSKLKCVQVGGDCDSNIVITPPTYSYYPKLEGIATVCASGTYGKYPYKDVFFGEEYYRKDYKWGIEEVKFKNLPEGGLGERPGDDQCAEIESKYSSIILKDSCKRVSGGGNLFPEGTGESVTKPVKSKQEGPDPIGTWTCYTIWYKANPKWLDELEARVRQYVNDWNDDNRNSNGPWPDGYYWVPPTYNPDGTIRTPGHYVGTKKNFDDEFAKYKNAYPIDPPKYKYTDFTENSCSLSGINPKIQVHGHDLKTGGDVVTYLQPIPVGNYQDHYGSWAEYGLMAAGVNRQRIVDDQPSMASGVGISYGTSSTDQATWSQLTFANSNPPEFGGFSFSPSPQPATETADTSHGTSFGGSYGAGTKVVYDIRGKGMVTIGSDITYGGGYSLISQLPWVVILADDIEIAPGVKRIDAWLIAEGGLSTCSAVPFGTPLDEADLTIDKCKNPLRFNGPVMAGEIFLYRTGGSRDNDVKEEASSKGWFNPDSSTDPNAYCEKGDCEDKGRATLSSPAETFSLRPDVFLSAYAGTGTNQPVATTDKITELPPRF